MSIALHRRSADLAPLAAIHAQCFPDPWDARALDDLLATPGTFLFAGDGGFILARAAASEAEILTLAVSPKARRAGTGMALVRAAAVQAQDLGAEALFLEVAADNRAARALYDRLGFAQAGLRKGYYAVPGAPARDALILRSNLPLPPGPPSGKVGP